MESKSGLNPLLELERLGQSVWIDFLSRELMQSGRLRQLMDQYGLKGITSNPTIFQKAIHGSELYDDTLAEMVNRGMRDPKELFLGIAFEDVGKAADMMLPKCDASDCWDGYVSIETSPDLAYDVEKTVDEVKRISATLDRKNVFVKVPATGPGVQAIEELTRAGISINVTLLFSVSRYLQVAEAYMRGLELRLEDGNPLDGIISVASFFVSRVDTLVDKNLEELIAGTDDSELKEKLRGLMGKAAVANARLAYREYTKICAGERLKKLQAAGAKKQRLLWASTGTKNPEYSDIKYVEELIGPETINTMTEDTIDAFLDHGTVREVIEEGLDEARALFDSLAQFGIEAGQVGEQLEQEGVKSFSDSFYELLDEIGVRRDRILSRVAESQKAGGSS